MMLAAFRFLGWMAIIVAVGAQAIGVGSLGFQMCQDRAGHFCGIEGPGTACCLEADQESTNTESTSTQHYVTCARCVDVPLTLPTAGAVTISQAWDDLTIAICPPIPLTLVEQPLWVGQVWTWVPMRGRDPPITTAVLVANMIVLRM
jgi:hypothetical protein